MFCVSYTYQQWHNILLSEQRYPNKLLNVHILKINKALLHMSMSVWGVQLVVGCVLVMKQDDFFVQTEVSSYIKRKVN